MVDEGTLLWKPSHETREHAQVSRYLVWLRESRGLTFASYDELWRWSTGEIDAFWASVWDYFQVEGERGDGPVHEGEMPGTRWFPGARLNYAHLALRRRDDHPAVVFRNEAGDARTLSYAELRREVARVAAGLRALGVGRGDRVAAYAPSLPETLITLLAAASIGAVWSSCSPDFGASSVIDRFRQIEPKVLLAVDGYRYNGRTYDRSDVVRRIEGELPSVEATVLVPYLSADA
ncbi:MAG: AMP-binding protein, partial [Streptosporangiaceae bacterium]